MTRVRLFGVALGIALSSASFAQSFNLDVGIGNPIPSPALGAAAGQPGTWNQIPPIGTNLYHLVDVSGAATGVTIQQTVGGGFDFFWDNPGTSGDDGLLMDDGQFPFPTSTWRVSGLAAGTYEVFTYAWASDDPNLVSGVSVNGGSVTPVGGAWPNGYVLGITHAFDTVTIPAGGTMTIVITTITQFATFNGVQIKAGVFGSTFTGYCSGDGTGTACPCANPGAAGNGCASSVNTAGAHLAGSGSASIGTDTMVLTGSGMPDSSALYFQGTLQLAAGAGVTFGDGLRCVGGTIIRLGTKTNATGTSTYPTAGDALVSVKGANSAGALRDYQCWYRNAAAFCTVSTFNLTNAVEVTWAP